MFSCHFSDTDVVACTETLCHFKSNENKWGLTEERSKDNDTGKDRDWVWTDRGFVPPIYLKSCVDHRVE